MTGRSASAIVEPRDEYGQPRPAAASRRVRSRFAYLRDITLHLVRRDFDTRHRGSVLGWLWALAPPLLQLLVTYFVFTKVLRLHVPNYPLFLLTGILTWNWFSRSLTLGAWALEGRRELVLRPGFPTDMLPVSAAFIGLLDYAITLPVLLIAIAASPGLPKQTLLLPIPILIQLVLSVGLCWILATAQVYFRDIGHMVGIVLLVGFWITPIWYTREKVPTRFQLVYRLNPMTHLIEAQRDLLLNHKIPSLPSLGYVTLVAVATFGLGYVMFRRFRDSVPEHL